MADLEVLASESLLTSENVEVAGFTLQTDYWNVSDRPFTVDIIEPVRVLENVNVSKVLALTLSTDKFATDFTLEVATEDHAKVSELATVVKPELVLNATASQSARVSEDKVVTVQGAAGYYLLLQHSRFLSDADRSVLTANDDAALITVTKGKVILATELGLDAQDTIDSNYKLQWRNVTDNGTFADVGTTGQVKWSTTTGCGKTDGSSITKQQRRCTNLDSVMTWQNGLFNLGDNLLPDSGVYVTASDIYTEFDWAIDLSDSLDNKQYQFQVYNITAQASCGVCAPLINVQPLAATTSDAVHITESGISQIDIPATASQAVRITEDKTVAVGQQISLNLSTVDSARIYEDNSVSSLLEPNISDTARVLEIQITSVEGQLADIDVPITETVSISELLLASTDAPVTLSPSAGQSARVSEEVMVENPLDLSLDESARARQVANVLVEDQISIGIDVYETPVVSESLSASIGELAARDISSIDSARARDILAVTVEAQITLAPSKTESVRVSEYLVVGAIGLGITLEASVEDSNKATEQFAVISLAPDLDLSLIESVRVMEKQTTEAEGMVFDVYPDPIVNAFVSESIEVGFSAIADDELSLVESGILADFAQTSINLDIYLQP